MPKSPSNDVLLEKINSIYAQNELHHKFSQLQFEEVNKKLQTMGEDVSKNTKFRVFHLGAYKIIGIIGGVFVAGIGIIKSWIG